MKSVISVELSVLTNLETVDYTHDLATLALIISSLQW